MKPEFIATLRNASDTTSRVDAARRASNAVVPIGLRQLAARRRNRRYVLVLAILFDILVVSSAFLVSSFFRFGAPFHEIGMNMIFMFLPIYLTVATNVRAYHIEAVARARIGVGRVILALTLALSAVGLVVFFLKAGTDFSRVVFAGGAAIGFVALPFVRFALAKFIQHTLGQLTFCEVIIVDGMDAPAGSEAVILDAQEMGFSARLDDPQMFDRLGRYVVDADRVVVMCPPERRALWAFTLKGLDINAEVLAPDLDQLGALGIGTFEGSSTLVVASAPLAGMDRTLKRMLDLTLTIAALPIVLPIMLAVAIAVRVDSPGPIFFTQKRVGLGNRIFKMYKFRSMFVDQSDSMGSRSAARGDNRITRVGRIIRATSLDELPQLLNVFNGAMSIVGPRPHPIECKAEDRLLWDIDLRYWHRHSVKPGLTGLAQVRGLRGATEKESHFTDRLQADLEYLTGWTVWRDIVIIIATFRVLVHRNAF